MYSLFYSVSTEKPNITGQRNLSFIIINNNFNSNFNNNFNNSYKHNHIGRNRNRLSGHIIIITDRHVTRGLLKTNSKASDKQTQTLS